MIDLIDIQNMFYSIYNKTTSTEKFETWLYENDYIENILGNELYFNLININYREKYSFLEVEKLILPHIDFGRSETIRMTSQLKSIIDEKGDIYSIMSQVYNDYCNGYYFLRYLGLLHAVNADDKEISNGCKNLLKSKYKYTNEAMRLLGFLEKGELIITDRFKYEDFRNAMDKLELNHIEKLERMYKIRLKDRISNLFHC